ncbi:hypothetical protein BOTBODRAFT_519275 [Botryobasidium botryosum FD-172 SS1]|uniref:Uncharacterized protein n=1 Tax=Botryobasidium botryosum (strain FD-172 SS1) TaxID=930990 RepID=A0A067N3J9_BOTB1|nr:hypothetical protein BOTBODRAFT_519275 [Botryobasidium botryosum FD-172 SS1]
MNTPGKRPRDDTDGGLPYGGSDPDVKRRDVRQERPRRDEKPKDWRDAHLAESGRGTGRGGYRGGDRREEGWSHRDRERYPRGGAGRREYDRRRTSASYRSRSPRQNRDRGHAHEGERERRNTRSRSRSRSRSQGVTVPRSADEKEEGEISPRPAPPIEATVTAQIPAPVTPTTSPDLIISQPEPEPEVDLLLPTPPAVEDRLAASRARREAILAKYKGRDSQPPNSPAAQSPGEGLKQLRAFCLRAINHQP